MKDILLLSCHWRGSGLTNQLFLIICGIIKCINEKIKILVLSDMLIDIDKQAHDKVSNIIDIFYLNEILLEYDIKVYDINDMNFKVLEILYGSDMNKVDITDKVIGRYVFDNYIYIPSDINLNDIAGDPDIGVFKKLYITYNINDITLTEIHNEYNRGNIYFDKRILFNFTNWEKDIEPHIGTDIFLSLLKKIRFVDKYKNESDMFYNKLTFNKINVVHLRVELDMIYRMDSNNMWAVRERIETSYIDLIKENIQKDDLTIILTYDLNNNVINYLKENGYNYFYTEKKYPEREYNAIIDFLIGERCNNIFIGFPVSTYSYSLEKRMNNVKSIYISI
jgi:hypothetical protein